MGALNGFLTGLFNILFRPFQGFGPIWALTVISLVAGVLMLWIFGKVSNQDAVRAVRDEIRGNLIGIRLFGNDLGLLFRLQGRILRRTLTYLRHALVPTLVMLVPVFLILAQLNLRFSVRPLEPGEATLVKVKLSGASPMSQSVELETSDGVVVETPGVRIESQREVAWRIRAERPGEHRLTVKVGDETAQKKLLVGSGWRSVPTLRTAGLLDLLLFPGEPPLDSSGIIGSIEVSYATLPLTFLFWDVNSLPAGWLIFFFIASIAFGFAFRRVLGVEI